MNRPFAGVDTLFLRVKDIPSALEWYEKNLGFKQLWRNDEGGFAAIDANGLPITFVQHKDETEFTPFYYAPFNLYVRDIEEVHRHLQENGVHVGPIEKLYATDWFWFKDMDGNRIEVCHYKK